MSIWNKIKSFFKSSTGIPEDMIVERHSIHEEIVTEVEEVETISEEIQPITKVETPSEPKPKKKSRPYYRRPKKKTE
jgi:hypothetical protein